MGGAGEHLEKAITRMVRTGGPAASAAAMRMALATNKRHGEVERLHTRRAVRPYGTNRRKQTCRPCLDVRAHHAADGHCGPAPMRPSDPSRNAGTPLAASVACARQRRTDHPPNLPCNGQRRLTHGLSPFDDCRALAMRGGRRGGRSRRPKKESPQAVERLRAKTYSKEVEMIVSNQALGYTARRGAAARGAAEGHVGRVVDAALRALAGIALALLITGVAPLAAAAIAIGALG